VAEALRAVTEGMAPGVRPFVSVVMPVRNEAGFIDRSLAAVLAQEWPADRLEVVIADGMSDDGTRERIRAVVDAAAARGPTPSVTIVDNPKRIAPAAMNVAIRAARGSVIVRVDGHAVLPPDYVRRVVDCLAGGDAWAVGGAVQSVGEGAVGEAIAAAMSSPFGIGGSGFRTRGDGDGAPFPTDTVPFGAFRREVFERVGWFNERMVRHQDYEFNYRLRRAGGTILLLPGARVVYYVRASLGRLWRQYWQYGIWKGRMLRAYPESLRPRHLIPPLFVAALALTAIAGLAWQPAAWAFAALAGLYVAYLLFASMALGVRGSWRHAPLLPAIMVCLQVGYGAGILLGLATPLPGAAGGRRTAA
jgi:succinoglycan biosynthesis protein ExoA